MRGLPVDCRIIEKKHKPRVGFACLDIIGKVGVAEPVQLVPGHFGVVLAGPDRLIDDRVSPVLNGSLACGHRVLHDVQQCVDMGRCGAREVTGQLRDREG